jgi:hypothetical protein
MAFGKVFDEVCAKKACTRAYLTAIAYYKNRHQFKTVAKYGSKNIDFLPSKLAINVIFVIINEWSSDLLIR